MYKIIKLYGETKHKFSQQVGFTRIYVRVYPNFTLNFYKRDNERKAYLYRVTQTKFNKKDQKAWINMNKQYPGFPKEIIEQSEWNGYYEY